MTTFTLSVEDDLTPEQAQQVLADLEEVLGKHSLSLDDAYYDLPDYYPTEYDEPESPNFNPYLGTDDPDL